MSEVLVSAVMPCLNEAETLAVCIRKAQSAFLKMGVRGEVVVADNGSTDGSIEIAEGLGARVVHQSEKGYGAALQAGIEGARGEIVVMGDSDDSYDWGSIGDFVGKIQEGNDFVMGN
ncbi:glycosyltransferase family 2 protein, partial [bacterium]